MRKNAFDGQLSLFGFNCLEERAYVALLQAPGQTGYKVAQALKKPVANVYKALESLLEKGAVLVEDGDPAVYQATPIAELFDKLETELRKQRRSAVRQLSAGTPPPDERVYRLGSREQTIQRARGMIASSKRVLLLDFFPNLVSELAAEISAAAARGVKIAGQIYAPAQFSGAMLTLRTERDHVLQRWAGDWMNLVADGQELLISVLERSGNGLHQAIWTRSPYLAWSYHSALYAEILLNRLRVEIENGTGKRKLLQLMEEYHDRIAIDAPGYKRLASRL
ncbi:MAG TPA: helix-turn-helix domain-containing protein [Candidatus Angelobacter sp.]|jgi:sugar-specific transcriptional regulator TrmB